jgi:hypothetical protein
LNYLGIASGGFSAAKQILMTGTAAGGYYPIGPSTNCTAIEGLTFAANQVILLTGAGTCSAGALTNAYLANLGTQYKIPMFGATGLSASILSQNSGSDLLLTQNSVVPFTSVNSGAVANTLYLKAGQVGIGGVTSLTNTLHLAPASALTAGTWVGMNIQNPGINTWGFGIRYSVSTADLQITNGGLGTGTSAITILSTTSNVGIGTTSPGTLLTVAGAIATKSPVTVSGSTYTVDSGTGQDFTLLCTYTAGSTTLTLPTASSYPGRLLFVKIESSSSYFVLSASSNVIPFLGGSAGTAILYGSGGGPWWAMLQSDGSNWHIISRGV